MNKIQDSRLMTHDSKQKNKKQNFNNFFCLLFSVFCFLSSVFCLVPYVYADPPLSYYEIIEQRNFFRPKQSDEDAASASRNKTPYRQNPAPDTELLLTGVIEIHNGYKAIVEDKKHGSGFYVSVNDMINDYTVEDIRENSIILKKNGKTYELRLKQARIKKGPAQEKSQKSKTALDPQDITPKTQEQHFNTMQKLRTGIGGPR